MIYVNTVYLHCTKHGIRYNSEKIILMVVNHESKLDYISHVIKYIVLRKDSKIKCFLNHIKKNI